MPRSTLAALVAAIFLAATVSSKHVPPHCSATFCGTNGSTATCLPPSGHVTTCAKYATTLASALSCRLLSKTCSNSCFFIPVYGSDGKPYCTPCHLHVFSCGTHYTVYGPVPYPFAAEKMSANTGTPEGEKALPFPAAETMHVPSASSHSGPVSALDTNVRESLLPKCSMRFCTVRGAKGSCFHETKTTTCGKFAYTDASKEQCSFFCIQICYPDGPVGSDGKKYCSGCHLRQASCQSKYEIYAPLVQATPPPTKPPVLTVCSVGFCTSNGAKASCQDKASGKASNCHRWAQTPAKDLECGFFCPLFCLPENERPVDNTGVKHCSGCQLSSASCAADFKIYGPVNSPGNDS